MLVVSYYFSVIILLPYYFLYQNYAAQVYFVSFFGDFFFDFPQKSKKICQFFAIFSRCVSTS